MPNELRKKNKKTSPNIILALQVATKVGINYLPLITEVEEILVMEKDVTELEALSDET